MSKSAKLFVQGNRVLKEHMSSSFTFNQIKEDRSFEIDGQREYIIAGDIAGTEEDLYLDSLVNGFRLFDRNSGEKHLQSLQILSLRLYSELPEEGKLLLRKRLQ